MKRATKSSDVEQMTDRVMVDIFKKGIQERQRVPRQLRGTWAEASDILRGHFGKISRVMTINRDRLLSLYRTALKELQ